MKDIFEQLMFIKPMLNINSPKFQETTLWALLCTVATFVSGLFNFLSESVLGITVYFTITLFIIMIVDLVTGLLASNKEKQKKESKKGLRWAVKFLVYIFGIYVLNGLCKETMATHVNQIFIVMQIIKFYVLFHICVWEIQSIDENFERLGSNFRIFKLFPEVIQIFKSKIGTNGKSNTSGASKL